MLLLISLPEETKQQHENKDRNCFDSRQQLQISFVSLTYLTHHQLDLPNKHVGTNSTTEPVLITASSNKDNAIFSETALAVILLLRTPSP